MLTLAGISPAAHWRAFLFLLSLLAAAGLQGAAPAGAPPELSQIGKPNAEEAAQLLEQFRRAGLAGEFFLEFDFRALPRRGEEKVFKGRLWGGRSARGTVFRLEVINAAGKTERLLLRNGPQAGVWQVRDGSVIELEPAAALAPIVTGVEISAFDLQMPFLYWPDATLEKIARAGLGRPAYAYLFRAPPEWAARVPGVGAARAYLDTQANALMQTELINPAGKIVKSFSIVSLKKVGDQYLPKQADYRNELTRDKTRFQVTAAALNLRLPAAVFEPAALAAAIEPPAAALLVRIDP